MNFTSNKGLIYFFKVEKKKTKPINKIILFLLLFKGWFAPFKCGYNQTRGKKKNLKVFLAYIPALQLKRVIIDFIKKFTFF